MSQHQAYPYVLNEEETHYKFQSIGKRGTVEKAVSFTLISPNVYNLALLDWNPVSESYVDDTITDNGDMPEIMATVMMTILDYLQYQPERVIVLSGNSNARTRLYQIAIGRVIHEVQESLTIFGYRSGKWFLFEPNGAFESFLIRRKYLDSSINI